MPESKSISVQQKQTLMQIFRSQLAAAIAGFNGLVWLAEQALPDVFGSWWPQVPFLELAILFGVFSLGRNLDSIVFFLKNRNRPFTFETSAKRVDHIKQLNASLIFHRNFYNPKITVEIFSSVCFLSDPGCVYQRIGTVKKECPRVFNKGDKHNLQKLLWGNESGGDNTDPSYMKRGGKNAMEKQYRLVLSITSSNQKRAEEALDVYIPEGVTINFIKGHIGKKCMVDAIVYGDGREYQELDETRLIEHRSKT